MNDDDDVPLPVLQDATLDEGTVERLLLDLSALAEDVEVRVKAASEAHAPEGTVSLMAAAEALRGGRVLGMQVRYRHGGGRWCDTLLRTPGGIRLVRMQMPG